MIGGPYPSTGIHWPRLLLVLLQWSKVVCLLRCTVRVLHMVECIALCDAFTAVQCIAVLLNICALYIFVRCTVCWFQSNLLCLRHYSVYLSELQRLSRQYLTMVVYIGSAVLYLRYFYSGPCAVSRHQYLTMVVYTGSAVLCLRYFSVVCTTHFYYTHCAGISIWPWLSLLAVLSCVWGISV